MKIRFLLLSLALFTARLDAFDLVSSTHTSAVSILASEPECVRLAVADLIGDAKKITGQTLPLTPNIQEAGVLIASMNHPESVTLIEKISPGFGNSLKGKWEAYRVEIIAGKLIIAGSDERGTMFGIYHFIEEMLGVDPLYFWSGLEPEKRDTLAWETVKLSAGEPTFRFRGWFINDEDLLTEWMEGGGKRNIQYPFYSQTVNPMIMRAVAESLVRSRCNMIIPASFIDILNPPEKVLLDECARRGVFLT
ncbi:MAG: glycosyl hydrolase 115 family protein, partial [Gloeobacteraceae cyanobacterium ES-bin-144]|nr:glycosyl hydrolase 115 family protein [Verrucomicrobiales bacterium]